VVTDSNAVYLGGLTFSVVTTNGPGRQVYTGGFDDGQLTRRSYSGGTPQ